MSREELPSSEKLMSLVKTRIYQTKLYSVILCLNINVSQVVKCYSHTKTSLNIRVVL